MAYKKTEYPLKLLEKSQNGIIIVKLKDGTEYIGRLERSDISMNLILTDAKQINEKKEPIVNYGRILIRGSNVLYISLDATRVE
ncbi:MAG: Sm ribonucleo [Thermoprotei archaeon]|nr:MAG: Sm ribonucleo [Thermoprotei archaeon]